MSTSSDTHKACPAGRVRRRFAALLLLAAAVVLAAAPASPAAGDPVASGSFRLKLSNGFREQLKRNRVQMKPKVLSVKEGSIDPVTGTGTLTLKGKLRFKHEDRKVVYNKVTASLGSNGFLKGNKVKLFRLRGATVVRNGFGVEISGVRAKFLKAAARKLNKKLDLNSLHQARAGEVTLSEQPQTVEVTGGMVHLVPDSNPSDGSGTVTSKLDNHCIDFFDGNTEIAPATKDDSDVLNPFYDFPVTGGTIGPQGTDGEVITAGGIRLVNNNGSGNDCDEPPAPPLNELLQTDLTYNLLENYISSRIVINGPAPPLGGDHGVGIGSNLDSSGATVSADPDNHTVTINGLVVRFNGGSALFLNSTFLQPPTTYDGALQFASGDLFGTVNLTVTTR